MSTPPRKALPAAPRLAWIALLGVAACGSDPDETWVERLPDRPSGVEALPASDTWLDLLQVPVESSSGGVAPAVEALELAANDVEESGPEEMQRGRAGLSAVLSDRRRAWVVPIADRISFEVEVERGGRLRTACAIDGPDGEPLPADLVASFGVELVTPGGSRSIAHARFHPATQFAWHEIRADVPGPGRLRFSASLEGAGEDLVGLAAALATPSLELDSSRVPDVVIVSVDTLRADRLGCYGYERETSPSIDRLAERGVVFENCLSQAPWTLPSYGSLFTSLYPAEHRAGISEKAEIWTRGGKAEDYEKLGQKLVEGVPTLAEELAKAGYRTAGFYFNPYLTPRTGVSRGFDEYAFLRYSANAGVDRALDWLRRNEGLPRFLFLQLIDPHWPYAPPAPWDRRFSGRSVDELEGYPWALSTIRGNPQPDKKKVLLSDLYDGEIAYTDAELGRLFEYLERPGTLDQVLVVFQSDHGEELWDHGRFEHGHSMHAELLRVPLIVSMPTLLAPGRVASSVRTVDVFPTVLDLLGLPAPDGLRGSSLVAMARGEAEEVQLVGFAESILWGRPYAPFDEAKALVTDGFKLVVGDGDSPPQLYSIREDALELHDLAAERPEEVERLEARLRETYRSARQGRSGETMDLGSERGQLDNLGYGGAHGEPSGDPDAAGSE